MCVACVSALRQRRRGHSIAVRSKPYFCCMMSLFVVCLLSVSDGEDAVPQFNLDNNICDVLCIYCPSVTERTQHQPQFNLNNSICDVLCIYHPSVTERTQHHNSTWAIILWCCASTVHQGWRGHNTNRWTWIIYMCVACVSALRQWRSRHSVIVKSESYFYCIMSLFVVCLLSVSDGEDAAPQFNLNNNICDVLCIYCPSVTERTQHQPQFNLNNSICDVLRIYCPSVMERTQRKQMNLNIIHVCCMGICSPSMTEWTQCHS